MPKVIIAIDSFKGCLTSKEANEAAADGVRSAWPEATTVQVPVSDGGEGFLEAFRSAGLAKADAPHDGAAGAMQEVLVYDPLMRPVTAKYLLCGESAVIEMAQASGLTLLSEEERDPMVATSYGTGQLVADAVRKGARHIIVGLGGSATSDAGIGMLRALVDRLSPTPARRGGAVCWDDITLLKDIRFTIATDVRNPLCGAQGAAAVFAPQKGATPDMVRRLEERARRFAECSARHFGYDRQDMPGAGAAGGLGYAFLQYLDADCQPGIQLLLERVRFREMVSDADLVITGEGSADGQTLMGKVPMGVLKNAGQVPVWLIAGRISDREALLKAGFKEVVSVNPEGLPMAEAVKKAVAVRNVRDTCRAIASRFELSRI